MKELLQKKIVGNSEYKLHYFPGDGKYIVTVFDRIKGRNNVIVAPTIAEFVDKKVAEDYMEGLK